MPTPTLSELLEMDAAQFNALTQTDMSGFTMEHVQQLTNAQLGVITTEQINGIGDMIRYLSDAQMDLLGLNARVALLSPIFMANIGSRLNKLSDSALALITPLQAKALTSISLKSLSATQISAFSDEALYNLKPELVIDLDSSVIASIVPAKFAKLSFDYSKLSIDYLTRLPIDTIMALTPAQIAALSPSTISKLTPEILNKLGLSTLQVAAITSTQMPALTLVNFNDLSKFSLTAMAALTGYQVSQLTKTQIQSITSEQIAVLQPGAIASLLLYFTNGQGTREPILDSVAIMGALTLNQLHAFGKRVYWLNNNIDAADYALLTSEQAKALFDRNGQRWSEITPAQIYAFAPADLENFPAINSSAAVYNAMTTAQISGFSTNSVGLITGGVIAQLRPTQFAALNLAYLNTHNNSVSRLVSVAPFITLPQLKSLSSANALKLTPTMLGFFTDAQLSALTTKNTLSVTQLNGLSADQRKVVKKVTLTLNYSEDKKYYMTWNSDAYVTDTAKMKIFITKEVKEVTSNEKYYTVLYSDNFFKLPNLIANQSYLIYAIYNDIQQNLITTNSSKIDMNSWPAASPNIICTRESTKSFNVSLVGNTENIEGALISYNNGNNAYGQYFNGPPLFSYNKLSYVVEDDRIMDTTVEVAMVIYTKIQLGNTFITVESELSHTILVSLDGRPNQVTDINNTYAKNTEGVVFMNVEWTPGDLFDNNVIEGYVLTVINLTKKTQQEIPLNNVTSYPYHKNTSDDYGDRIMFSIRGFYYSGISKELRNESDEVFSNELKLVGFSATAPSNISDSLRGNKLVRQINNVTFTIEPSPSLGRFSSEVIYVARVYNSSNSHASPVKTYYIYNNDTAYTTSITEVDELVNGYSISYASSTLFDNVYVTVTEMVANMTGSVITDVIVSSVSSSSHVFFVPSTDKLLYTSTVSNTGTEMVSGGLKVSFNGETPNPNNFNLTGIVYHQDIYLGGVKIQENILTENFSYTYPSYLLNDNQTSTVSTYCTLPFPADKMHPEVVKLYNIIPVVPFAQSQSASIELVNVTPQTMDFITTGVSGEVTVTWSILPNIEKDKLTFVVSLISAGVEQVVPHSNIVIDGNSYSTKVSGLINDVGNELKVTNKYSDYNIAPFSDSVYGQIYDINTFNIEGMIVSSINNRNKLSCVFLQNISTGVTVTGFETKINNVVVDNSFSVFSLPSELTTNLSSLKDKVNVDSFHYNKSDIKTLNDTLQLITLSSQANAAIQILNNLKFHVNKLSNTLQGLSGATVSVPSLSKDVGVCKTIIDLIDQLNPLNSRNYLVNIENLTGTFSTFSIRAKGNFTNSRAGQKIIYGNSETFNADKVDTVVSNLTYDSTRGDGTVDLMWDSGLEDINTKYVHTLYAQWPGVAGSRLEHTLVPTPITLSNEKWRTTVTLPTGWNFLITVVTSYVGYTNFHNTTANVQSYDKNTITISNAVVSQITERIISNFNFLLTKPERGFTLDNYIIDGISRDDILFTSTVNSNTFILETTLVDKMQILITDADLLLNSLPNIAPYSWTGCNGFITAMRTSYDIIFTRTFDQNNHSLDELKKRIQFVTKEIIDTVTALITETETTLIPFALDFVKTQLILLNTLIEKFILNRNYWVTATFNGGNYENVTIKITGTDSNDHLINGINFVLSNLTGNKQSIYDARYDNTNGVSGELILKWDSDYRQFNSMNKLLITGRHPTIKMPINFNYTTYEWSSNNAFFSSVYGLTDDINYYMTIQNYHTEYTNFVFAELRAQTYKKADFYISDMIVATAPNPASYLNFKMNSTSGVSSTTNGLTINGKNIISNTPNVSNVSEPKVEFSLSDGLKDAMKRLKQKLVNLNLELAAYIVDSRNPFKTPSFNYDLEDLVGDLDNVDTTDGSKYIVTPYALNQLYNEIIFRRNELKSLATVIKNKSSDLTLSKLQEKITKIESLIDNFVKPRNQLITRTMDYTFNKVDILPIGTDLNGHVINGTPTTVQVDKVDTTVSNLAYLTNGDTKKAKLSWRSKISKTDDSYTYFNQDLTATLQDGTVFNLDKSQFNCVTGADYNTWFTIVSNAPDGNNITYTITSSYNGLSNFSSDNESGQAYDKTKFVLSNMVKTPLNGGYMFRCNVMVPSNMTLGGFNILNAEEGLIYPNVSYTQSYSMNTDNFNLEVVISVTGLTNDTKYVAIITPYATDQNSIRRNGTTYSTLENCYPRIVPSNILNVYTSLNDNSKILININNYSSVINPSTQITTFYETFRKKSTQLDSEYVSVNTSYYSFKTSHSWIDNLGESLNGNTYTYKVVAKLYDANNSLDNLKANLLLYTTNLVNSSFFATALPQDLYDAPKLKWSVINSKKILILNMNGSPINGLIVFTTMAPLSSGNMNPVDVNYYDANSFKTGGLLRNLVGTVIQNSASGSEFKGIWTIPMDNYVTGSNVVAIAWNSGGAGTATIRGSALGIETSNEMKLTSYNNIQSDLNDYVTEYARLDTGDVLANMNTTSMQKMANSINVDDGFIYLPFNGMNFFFYGSDYGNSNGSIPSTSIYLSSNGAFGFGEGSGTQNIGNWPERKRAILFDFFDSWELDTYVSPVQYGQVSSTKYVRVVTTRTDTSGFPNRVVKTAYEVYYVRDSKFQYMQFNCSVKNSTPSVFNIANGSALTGLFGSFNSVAGGSYVIKSDLNGNNLEFFPHRHLIL